VRRLAAIVAVLAAAVVVVVVALAASSDGGGYKVRAIFDSAFTVIPGEDVKIAGVKVGDIESLHVTEDNKAAVVLNITEPGFGDWREDASCIIRPQSLIGERFVECTPTQPRAEGEPEPPPLREIESGEGEGQHLLPVENTKRNVDLDLINDIYQLPERQRLSIILNELGAGVAARGEDLNEVIRRANPALAETDKVLDILRQQNRVLADLASESDAVLRPLARDRAQVADFITQAKTVSQATAARRGDLERNFERLPRFLSELRPTLERLGELSDEMTPVLTDLGAQADNINRFVETMGPLAESARPAIRTLGEAAVVGTDAMRKIRPITEQVNELSASARPVADDLDDLLVSLRDTGGIERAMDYLFFQMTAINGFDSAGHYLRAGLLLNTCSTYTDVKFAGCEATFTRAGQTRSAPPADDGGARLASSATRPAKARAKADDEPGGEAIRLPDGILPGSGTAVPVPDKADGEPADAESTTTTTTTTTTSRLLDYLLGGEG